MPSVAGVVAAGAASELVATSPALAAGGIMRAFLGLGAIGCNAWAVGIVRLGPVADGTAADLPSDTSANWDGGARVFSWPLRADAALGEATWPTRRPKSMSPIKNM